MLKKLTLKAGVNRENTRYTNENGWYDSNNVRFRQGTPQKIGGWQRISDYTFTGLCRSLWNWVTLTGDNLLGVGTEKKFYIERGGQYNDITPLWATHNPLANNPFATVVSTPTVTVTDATTGYVAGQYVTFSGATAVAGLTLNGEYVIQSVVGSTYTITASSNASATTTGGGAAVSAAYQLAPGLSIAAPVSGWGSGTWSSGTWGFSAASTQQLRLWSQSNFGEDLIFGYRGGPIYYWDATSGLTARAVALTSMGGASDVPTIQNLILVSDTSRFVFAFGANTIGTAVQDPMLIRWSDQENATQWTPAATNQAGDIRLSIGSTIIAALQTRQEILVWTDAALYSLQYAGPPTVWNVTLLASNISIMSPNAMSVASGVVYWMGIDKFYKYDGRVDSLRCDLRQYVFSSVNQYQAGQVFSGTNEGFNEIWWFYCSDSASSVDSYIVFNYEENIWYYGSMARTAWLDSGISSYPMGATYSNNIVYHENGVDDNTTTTTIAIPAFIQSAEFDIDDGDRFGFVWRMLPDISFIGSTAESPQVTMYLEPMVNSGSGYTTPASEGGTDNATVTRTTTVPIEQFTGQVYVRVRGRQMAMKIESTEVGVAWQLGSPRIDIRQDGRR